MLALFASRRCLSLPVPVACLAAGLCALALCMGGCESTIAVDPPDQESQLVVNSFFSNDERWVVTVSESVGAFEPVDPEASRFDVNNADVTVTPSNGAPMALSFTDTLTATRVQEGPREPIGPAYVAFMPTPTAGQTYTLRAEAPGFQPVEAKSTVPAFPSMAVTSTARRVSRGGVDPNFVRQERTVTLRIDDPPNRRNRYWIEALYVDSIYVDSSDTYRITRRSRVFTTRSRPIREEASTTLDDDGIYRGDAAFFDDALFDGTTYAIDLVFKEFFDTQRDPQRNPYVVLNVAALSPDMYDYLVSVRRYDTASENPFAEPVTIHSNMDPGYGIFAGRHENTFVVRSELVGE